jgi:hypothetical protein
LDDEVTGMRENLLELLTSCETFQKGFDGMTQRQLDFETKIENTSSELTEVQADNEELQDQFAKLSDKFSSLHLEYQVDKGNTKAQLDNMGYNVAILTAKIPTESFSSSGVRSASENNSENSDGSFDKTDKNSMESDSPPLSSVKDVVSALIFSNDSALSDAAAGQEEEVKNSQINANNNIKGETKGGITKKMSKFVSSKSGVTTSHPPYPPPHPGAANLWLSPDGGMVAIQPTLLGSSSPSAPTPPRPWGRGGVGQISQPAFMGPPGQHYPGLYNYPNYFFHR